MNIVMIDVRQIRDALTLSLYKMGISTSEDTLTVLELYGLPALVSDVITYGTTYIDIPGHAHYAIIYDKLVQTCRSELDREILDIVLEEIEWIVHSRICNHHGTIQVITVSPPLLFVRLLYADY